MGYPTSVQSFTTKTSADVIQPAHVNDLQTEIAALEGALLTTGLAHHLLFVDATYDIGQSGATRPRHLYLSGDATVGATLTANALSVTGFTTHTISAGGTGSNILAVRNTTSGVGNDVRLRLGNDAASDVVDFIAYSGGHATLADRARINVTREGGLDLMASHASGPIRMFAGGTTEWARLTTDGGLALKDGITAPATAAGFACLYVDTADGDLKVKFGDGTVKTISVDT
jgi:hypothetical protein